MIYEINITEENENEVFDFLNELEEEKEKYTRMYDKTKEEEEN